MVAPDRVIAPCFVVRKWITLPLAKRNAGYLPLNPFTSSYCWPGANRCLGANANALPWIPTLCTDVGLITHATMGGFWPRGSVGCSPRQRRMQSAIPAVVLPHHWLPVRNSTIGSVERSSIACGGVHCKENTSQAPCLADSSAAIALARRSARMVSGLGSDMRHPGRQLHASARGHSGQHTPQTVRVHFR